jgi:hypothetical protein
MVLYVFRILPAKCAKKRLVRKRSGAILGLVDAFPMEICPLPICIHNCLSQDCSFADICSAKRFNVVAKEPKTSSEIAFID